MVGTLRNTARGLLAVVSVLVALFIAVDCASAQVKPSEAVHTAVAAETRPALGAISSHHDTGAEDCHGLRGGRAPFTAPTPSGKYGCVCGCDHVASAPRTAVTTPVPERQTVPLMRSGELPVLLQIFRC